MYTKGAKIRLATLYATSYIVPRQLFPMNVYFIIHCQREHVSALYESSAHARPMITELRATGSFRAAPSRLSTYLFVIYLFVFANGPGLNPSTHNRI